MAAPGVESTVVPTFPRFNTLPPEARRTIWAAATFLDTEDDSTILFFEKKFVSPNEGRRTRGNNDTAGTAEDHRFVRSPTVNLLGVNREARDVALDVLKERGYRFVQNPGTPGQILVRPCDPSRDAVFVPCRAWHSFTAAYSMEQGELS